MERPFATPPYPVMYCAHRATCLEVCKSWLRHEGATIAGGVSHSNTPYLQPVFRDGVAYGLMIVTLPPASRMRALGAQEGDILVSINGIGLSSPETALTSYLALDGGRTVLVELERGSQRHVVEIRLIRC